MLAVLATAAAACATPVAAPASTVYRYRGDGRLVPSDDPALPPVATSSPLGPTRPAPPRLHSAVSAVKRAIARARANERITADDGDRYLAIYSAARHARADMPSGTRRTELGSVLATLDEIARAGDLTASRMPALFLQLDRNRELWTGVDELPATHDRIVFPDSQLIFEYYPGEGLQIQPLANFGRADGLYTACSKHYSDCDPGALRALLDELLAIRSLRGGFTTWEYWFRFGGGTPPWTSAMAQGTAIMALARAAQLLDEPRYRKAAHAALGAFERRAPVGVRTRGLGGGVHYLLYSFAPGTRVLNAFAQTLNGLYEFYVQTGNRRALRLFQKGDLSMRQELPLYDTGAWTRYSLGGAEASLEYEELATDVVAHICKRSAIDFYCGYAQRLASYLTSPTRIDYRGPDDARKGEAAELRFWIGKVSTVSVEVTDPDGKPVFSSGERLARGRHVVDWVPQRRGPHRVTFSVVDLRGNQSDLVAPVSVH
ncbi:MAG: hypothetical protein QOI65_57 [Thermoleophilaceae bacterium]|nr:hypothetical protein [Thermoleophilaceae bacterium]